METYRITIEKVIRDYVKETKTAYFNKKDGTEVKWHEYYNSADSDIERDAKFASHAIETGKVETSERREKIYEQEKANLEVADLALFINRNR